MDPKRISRSNKSNITQVAGFAIAALWITGHAAAANIEEAVDHAIREAHWDDNGKTDPKYRTLFSPMAKWAGAMHWKYNHANAPASLGKDAAVAQLKSSLDKWTAQCGVTHVYDGETTVLSRSMMDLALGPGSGVLIRGTFINLELKT